MRSDIVPSRGPVNSRWMIVGEAPGKAEYSMGRPFVGPSGQEQDWYLRRANGPSANTAYVTNVVKRYIEGNPDPTSALIAEWSPVLEREIADVRPELIVAVGRFAARWFLGDGVNMDMVHGLPHRAGDFDPSRRHRGGPNDAIIVPIYHPAFGLYEQDKKSVIAADYEAVVDAYKRIHRGEKIRIPVDRYAGQESYADVSGADLADILGVDIPLLGLDTEGYPIDPWSIQISTGPGNGFLLRRSRPDFIEGIRSIRSRVRAGSVIGIHNALYDIEMSRAMKLELRNARIYDTMYAAFLTRLNPQSLKMLAYRQCRMRMEEHNDVVANYAGPRHMRWILKALEHQWPKPPAVLIQGNNGVARPKQPQAIKTRLESILAAYVDSKRTLDIYERWSDTEPVSKAMVEDVVGPLTRGSLADAPLDVATRYACRDADAVSRLVPIMRAELERLGLEDSPKTNHRLMTTGMKVLPIVEEMQFEGFYADRDHFVALAEDTSATMERLQRKLSYRYFDRRPFNPMSADNVRTLMRRRGIQGEIFTKTKQISTGKKSIAHYRKIDDAMGMVFDWREAQKVRDGFCLPILEKGNGTTTDRYKVRCHLLTTRVHTRRLASKDPNFLAMPVRTKIGKRLREGFFPLEGRILGGWDYSQIEARRAADLSGDPILCALFIDGRCKGCGTTYPNIRKGKCPGCGGDIVDQDIHAATAATIFRIALDLVNKETQRTPAKSAFFGILYGISGKALFDQFRMMGGGEGWDEFKCQKLIDDVLALYSGLKRYIRSCGIDAENAGGVIQDEWGMMRYIPGISHYDHGVADAAARIAMSHRVQGGAQGMIQNAMVWIDKRIRKMRKVGAEVNWVLQIHDEVILSFTEDLKDEVDGIVREGMNFHHGVSNVRVPIDVNSQFGEKWSDLK